MKARPLTYLVSCARRRDAAGFTLLEIMVVVMVIGVLAAMGIPSIISQMRDRRTNQAAHEVALLYRRARSMAMGRGTAVLVRFTGTGQGQIQMLEAQNATSQQQGNCAPLPSPSCLTNSWTVPNPDNRVVSEFEPLPSSPYDGVSLQFSFTGSDGTISPMSNADVCFTPLGRTYIRFPGGTFQTLNSVPYVEVSRADGIGFKRTVLVLPNGTSRLAL